MGREVQHLASVIKHKVSGSLAHAHHSWQEHRAAAKARRAQGSHRKHLRLPWRRRRQVCSGEDAEKLEAVGPEQAAAAAAERGMQLQAALDIQGAIAAFEEANKLVPGNAHYLACLSKQWSDITFIPETPSAEAKASAEKGIDFASQAELAAVVRSAADAALAADPESDLALHLLGRYHSEMAQLNFVVRALVRVMYGTALAPGSHAEALAAYQRASELAPQRLIHRVELARTALRLGQTTRAARELQIAVELPIEDINAHLTRLDGIAMLESLRKQGRLTDVLQPAVPIGSTAVSRHQSSGQVPAGA